MTTLYLIRHAEAEGNRFRRCHGWYDSTITDNGYRQIAALAKRFAQIPIDAVYSSDLTRTQTTALAITRTHGLPLRLDPRLREVGVGPWEDRTWTWLATHERERLVLFNSDLARWRLDGAETMEQVRERMLAAVRDVAAAHPGQTVAVVSHGMALRTLLGTLQGMSFAEIDRTGHAENTAVAKLEADGSDVRVVWRDDASHLPDALTTLHKQLWTKRPGGIEPGIWFAPDEAAEGRFLAVREDGAIIGAVAVGRIDGAAAELSELRLDDAARNRGYDVRLLGQAISYARARGCDTLRAQVAPDNASGRRRLAQYGFREKDGALEKYFGYSETYRIARFDEAWNEIKSGG